MEPASAAWLALGFYVVAVPLIAAARYWMRRYQLSRTRWRGIRLGLAGSGWGFAFASWGWTMLQTLSLGWYTPVARMNRAKLMWENTRFGDQPFDFVDDGKPAAEGLVVAVRARVGRQCRLWFIAFIVMGFAIAALGLSGLFNTSARLHADNRAGGRCSWLALFVGVALLALTLMALFWAPYNAAAMNRIASLIELDGARFRLRAKTFVLFWDHRSPAGSIIIFSLGLLAPIAGFLQVRYVINRLELVGTPRFAEIGQSIVEGPKAGESLG